MPAVTADTLTLSKIPAPEPGQVDRPVRSVTTTPRGYEGEGFPVRRAFAGVDLSELDPFVHMDQMGEVDYGPGEPRGTDWHPTGAFETSPNSITATSHNQNSPDGGGGITTGPTERMTAGGGALPIQSPPGR